VTDPFELTGAVESPLSDTPQTEGYEPCSECGKVLKLKADGTVRAHKCTATETVTSVATVKPKAVRRGRKAMPDQVRRLGVAAAGAGIEWSTEKYVTRITDLPVPTLDDGRKLTELPDPDGMIGPFLNTLWPQIPAGGQKVIAEIAGHEDLIGAVFAWLAYMQQLRSYVDAVTERKTEDEPVPGSPVGQQEFPRIAGHDPSAIPVLDGTGAAFGSDT
jgi:hypothetical protein